MMNNQCRLHYALIGYKQDFDPKKSFETKNYTVTVGGVRNRHDIAISDGKSTEFMMEYTFKKLENLRDKIPPPG